jgi:hypothetical protein
MVQRTDDYLRPRGYYDNKGNLLKVGFDVINVLPTDLDSHKADTAPHNMLSAKAASGYQKLPSGIIIQWGNVTSSATPTQFTLHNLPMTFPTAFVSLTLTADGSISASATAQGAVQNLGQFYELSNMASQPMYYMAIGY